MAMMRHNRGQLFLALLGVAIAMTLVFLLSTLFTFGISTHRSVFMSWNESEGGYKQVQLICYNGQFHLTVDFSTRGGRHPVPLSSLAARTWQAGIEYHPRIRIDLHDTNRWSSKAGIDGFLIGSGGVSVGVFGLYPTALAWLLVWLFRKKHLPQGHCVHCGYDLRATPDRCPECGTIPTAAKGAAT